MKVPTDFLNKLKPFYFCNKCGYTGQAGPDHPKPSGSQCDYWAASSYNLTAEEYFTLLDLLGKEQDKITEMKLALEWYATEAIALAKNMEQTHDMAILASVQVLALDRGNRATKALFGETL